MNEREIFKGVADTLTDKPYTIGVPVRWMAEPELPKRTIIDRILGRKPNVPEQPKVREFAIYPCVVANMYRIAGAAALLPDGILPGEELVQSVLPLVPEHLPTMVYIIAAAIQNDHLEPSNDLVAFIERNFTQKQIAEALYASIEGLGLDAFLNSIVSAKGTVAVLDPEASPADGRE